MDLSGFAFGVAAGVTDVHEPADDFDFLADFVLVGIAFAKAFENVFEQLLAERMFDPEKLDRIDRFDDVEGHVGLIKASEFVEGFAFGKGVHVDEEKSIRGGEEIFEMTVPM